MEPDSEFKKLEQNLDGFETFGHDLQAKGNDIVRDVGLSKKALAAFRKYINLMDEQKVHSWLAAANMSCSLAQPHIVDTYAHINYINAIVATTATTGGTLFFGLTSSDTLPPQAMEEISQGRDEISKRLDDYLKKFRQNNPTMPDLVGMRKGAWQAFNSPFAANLTQAAHDMRDILSKIVSQLAPNSEVELALWYKPCPPKNSPTETDRLKYLLAGLNLKLKESVLKMLSLPLEALNEKYNRLKSIAHGSETNKTETEACMIATEDLMLAVFSAQELNSGK